MLRHAMPCHAQLKQYSCRSSPLCTCSSSSSSLISSTLIYFRRSRKCNRLQMERTWCSAWEKQLIQSLAKAGRCLHAAWLRWSIRSKMEMNRKNRMMSKTSNSDKDKFWHLAQPTGRESFLRQVRALATAGMGSKSRNSRLPIISFQSVSSS